VGLVVLSLLIVSNAAAQQASIVLHNGKVLTVDPNFSTAEAVAITGNKITAVGRSQDVLQQAGPNTLKIDLKGRTVVPGLIDTHLHITGPGQYAGETPVPPEKQRNYLVDWRAVSNKQDVLNQIDQLMKKFKPPAGEWIAFNNRLSFSGLNNAEPLAKAKILYDELTRWDLDKVIPNNPAILTMGIPDENALFLNSKAFDFVWDRHTDFLKKYGRYWLASNGQPDGHIEPPFTRLILNKYAPRSDGQSMAPGLRKMLEELSAQGHTTISTKLRQNSIDAYKILEQRSQLIMRLAYGMGFDHFGSVTDFAELKQFGNQAGTGTEMIWLNSMAPSSVDGATTRSCTNQKRSGGAYGTIDSWFPVGQCHTDNEYKGSGRAANINGNYFQDWVMAMGQYGLRLANDHVAGDRSVANLLNMIERLQGQLGANSTRQWAFDHCTMVDPKDFARAARLRVMFSCAPKYIEDNAPAASKSYGPEVANNFIVPVKSMIKAGVRISYEADRDTYVWEDLELFLTRKSIDGKVYGPQERLDKVETLKSATIWAADYVLKPDTLGSLEVGKLADVTVLDKDYMAIPEEQVSEIQPQLTILDGKIVFVHSNFANEYNLRPSGAIVSTFAELKARRPAPVESMVGEGGG
jgi:predicted amidohydrolase YtcJ